MDSAAWKQRQDESSSGEDQDFLHKLYDRGEICCPRSCFSHCFSIKVFCPGASKNDLTLAFSTFIRQKNCPWNPQRMFLSSNCSQMFCYKPSRFSFYTRRAELQFCPSALSSKSSPLNLVQGIGLTKSLASVKATHLVSNFSFKVQGLRLDLKCSQNLVDNLLPHGMNWGQIINISAILQIRSGPGTVGWVSLYWKWPFCLCLFTSCGFASPQAILLHQVNLIHPPPSFPLKFLNLKSNWDHPVTSWTDCSVFCESKLIFLAWEHPGSTLWPSDWGCVLGVRENAKVAFDCQCCQEIWAILY